MNLESLSEGDKQRLTEIYQVKHKKLFHQLVKAAADARANNDLIECTFLFEACNALLYDSMVKIATQIHKQGKTQN